MIFLVKFFAISLAWTLVQSDNQRDKVFFLKKSPGKDPQTLLIVTWTESSNDELSGGCEVFTDKDLINEVLESSRQSPIRTVNEDELENVFHDCIEFSLRRRRREAEDEEENETIPLNEIINDSGRANRRTSRRPNRRRGRNRGNRNRQAPRETTTLSNAIESTINSRNTTDLEYAGAQSTTNSRNETDYPVTRYPSTTTYLPTTTYPPTTTDPPTTMGYDGLPIVYPGTKWCGAGAIARSFDDLGMHKDTDQCCRAHDLCNDTLAPGETRYNLTNTSPFTKLSCKCDRDFYNCLSRVNSFTSNSIGNMYFNILKRDCYKKEYPLTKKCKSYLTLFKITCTEYERNRTAEKVYQWIPAQKYTNVPVPG